MWNQFNILSNPGHTIWHGSSLACKIWTVYIPLSTKGSKALSELHDSICSFQNEHKCKEFLIIIGDLNHVNLTDVLSGFYQHVTITTWGDNTLNCVHKKKWSLQSSTSLPPCSTLHPPEQSLSTPTGNSVSVYKLLLLLVLLVFFLF